jgi:Carboxypeptidase regulatory-like domain/TonB dependent receptor
MKALLGALVLLLGAGVPVAAQAPTGTIRGFIHDQSNAIIPGADVELVSQTTAQRRQTVSTDQGMYEFAFVPVGRYQVTVTLAGFKTVAFALSLEVDQTQRLDFTLKLATTSETITVVGEIPLVQTTSSSPGAVIGNRQMTELPLNSRDFQQLTLLAPGSVVPPGGDVTFTINVAGQRTNANDFLVDGVTNVDLRNNQIILPPNVETVQEFKIQENAFSAEYGRASGAVVNIVTRSGTNTLTGTVFEFLRNDKFDARNYFDNPNASIPPFKRNVFGGVAGGPIVRGKTFFFFSYEGRRQRESVTMRAIVPTAEQRLGIFRNAAGAIVTDVSSQISPVSQKLLELVPLPDSPGTFNWVGVGKRPRNVNQYSIKVDHDFNSSNRTTFSWLWQHDIRTEPATSTNMPGFGDTREAHRYHATVSHQSTLTSHLVNQTVAGFNMLDAYVWAVDTSSPASYGIGNSVTSNIGLPNLNVVGWFQLGHGTAPYGWQDPKFSVRDAVSYVTGRQSFKAGGEWRTWLNRQYGTSQGTFSFDGTFTGQAVGDFLVGRSTTVAAVFGDQTTRLRQDVYSLFLQDDVQVSPKLTLNLGARYEYYTAPLERDGLAFQAFDPQTDSLVSRDFAYAPQKFNLAPRLGFAFDPRGDSKTAIRGGYGMFYNQGTLGIARNLVINPPEAVSITFRGTTLADPFAGQGTVALPTINTVDANISPALTHSFNVNVQRQLLSQMMLEVGYYGSVGRNLPVTLDINQAVYIPGASTALNTDQRRPYKGFSSILAQDYVSTASYHSLQIILNRRLAKGFTASGSYVLAKATDYGSSDTARPQNSGNLAAESALSDFDVRHRVVINAIWEIPGHLSAPLLNAALSGWQLSGVSQYQSGSPLNIILSSDNSLTGERLDRPNLVGNPQVADPSPNQWFNASAFAAPAVGTFGTMPRNSVLGPSFINTDLALMKNFGLTNGRRVQFRFEVYNLTNHPNFGSPGLQRGTASFGLISSTRTIRGDAGSSRQLQLGLKFTF